MANPVTLTSESGVLTLSAESNSFIAGGAEAITSIVGGTDVSQGIYVITWNTARTLTYDSSRMLLIGKADRTTAAGDVGVYQIVGDVATELSYSPVSGKVASAATADTAAVCTGNAATATKLATARTISLTGDATGSAAFDGSADVSAELTLANSGVTAGTYKSVTVDGKGRVTAGTNPTTLAGYGITDALPLAGGTMTGALHQPNPINITSDSGVLTLTEGGNSFVASGSEAITSIAGWTKGVAMIRWDTARTLTYNATSLILQGAVNRTTAVGDVGFYEMTAAGAREVGYSSSVLQSPYKIAVGTVVNGGTIPLPSGCTSHAGIIVSPAMSPTSFPYWELNWGYTGCQQICTVNQTTRVVTCGMYYFEGAIVWGAGTANYMIFGVA